MYNKNNNRPRTETSGTPQRMGSSLEVAFTCVVYINFHDYNKMSRKE